MLSLDPIPRPLSAACGIRVTDLDTRIQDFRCCTKRKRHGPCDDFSAGVQQVHCWHAAGPLLVYIKSSAGVQQVQCWCTSSPVLACSRSIAGVHQVQCWRAAGPVLACSRSSAGVQQVHCWHAAGPLLVYIKSSAGVQQVHCWHSAGPLLVYIKSSAGMQQVQCWRAAGPMLACSRSSAGVQQVQCCSAAGPLLVYIKSSAGVQQVQCWRAAGPVLQCSRSIAGVHQVHCWHSAGPLLVYIKSSAGVQQVQFWREAGGLFVVTKHRHRPHQCGHLTEIYNCSEFTVDTKCGVRFTLGLTVIVWCIILNAEALLRSRPVHYTVIPHQHFCVTLGLCDCLSLPETCIGTRGLERFPFYMYVYLRDISKTNGPTDEKFCKKGVFYMRNIQFDDGTYHSMGFGSALANMF
ncbi:hypothetical protein J6590_059569 [Homalodisca vitripennis]|nr:hypothetical protein J6590_059569 [Homalodisca vitripennis]